MGIVESLKSLLVTTQPELRKPRTKRSSQWPKVRAEHLKNHPACLVTGSTKELEVHHIFPVHLFPELELSPENLVTLSEGPTTNFHFLVGHLLDWRAYNPNVLEDAKEWFRKLKSRAYG